jgi:hypothetical protein
MEGSRASGAYGSAGNVNGITPPQFFKVSKGRHLIFPGEEKPPPVGSAAFGKNINVSQSPDSVVVKYQIKPSL